MIELKDITKSFDGKIVFENANFTFEQSKVTRISGYGDSGKTAILDLISGLFLPTSGKILIDGENPYDNPKIKQKLFYVRDDSLLPESCRIKRAAKLYGRFYPNYDAQLFSRMCSAFNINERWRIRILTNELKCLLLIFIAISSNMKYILIDDMPNFGDSIMNQQIMCLLYYYSESAGATIIFTTSYEENIFDKLCTIAAINNNKIINIANLEVRTDEK